jgi:hypothetical protein
MDFVGFIPWVLEERITEDRPVLSPQQDQKQQ